MHAGIKHAGNIALGTVVVMAATAAQADDCFSTSARRYGLDASLLRAVAGVESNMQAGAVNRSHLARTGTVDVGLMQVNTSWLKRLQRYGIREADLHQPCTNIEVGAWILAQAIAQHGNQWQAVGAYNAGCSTLKGEACTRQRAAYAWRVYRRMTPGAAGSSTTAAPTPMAPARSSGAVAMASLHRVSLERGAP